MADQEKDTLACALESFARMLRAWALRRETPVTMGRMMVAVAVSVEMGNEKAWILYRTMLRYHQPCNYGVEKKKISGTNPPTITRPTRILNMLVSAKAVVFTLYFTHHRNQKGESLY